MIYSLMALIFLISQAEARADLKFSGFLDTYYAYDFNRPNPPERQFTTQPARHNEFNVNLAMLSVEMEKTKSRGKLTLQHGTSVVKNYSAEPTAGATSGPRDAQMLQESYVGIKLGEGTWLDGGIYLGHIGMESWISKDNWTYTRSLMSEYTPYYQAGLRLSHKIDEANSVQLHLINGWQIISENNQDKSLGLQYVHVFSSDLSFTYNNWLGNELAPRNTQSTMRTYHNFHLQYKISTRWEIKLCGDLGTQARQESDGDNIWATSGTIARYMVKEKHFMAFRAEYFHDKEQSNAATLTPKGFQTWDVSANYDWHFDDGALARVEYRHFFSKDPIFPRQSGLAKNDSFLVGNLALAF